MDKQVITIAIAGLLHDVGKFMQRAELEKKYPGIKRNYGGFCPVNKHGIPGYLHAAHTAWFIENLIPDGIVDKNELYNAARHHKNPPGDLYREADCLSSGMERHREEESSDDKGHYKKVRLHSVLEYMAIERNTMKTPQWRHELLPLDDAAKSCCPVPIQKLSPPEDESLVASYTALWDGFEQDFRAIETQDAGAFLITLLALLEKYTWCIPSSTMDRPDISLFDHAKTTSAIAVALHCFHRELGDLATARIWQQDEVQKFILLAGDLSGIQSYLFGIANVGAGGTAKRLRARSFFLSALSDIAAHRILHECDLSLPNQIMSSGGKFYLLLPNTKTVCGAIAKLTTEFNDWLLDHLNGEVALNLAKVSFSCSELLRFDRILKSVNNQLQKEKNRPFHSSLTTEDGWHTERFIADRIFENEESLCRSCGKFAGVVRDDDLVRCDYCEHDIRLGRELAKAAGIQFFNNSKQGDYSLLGYSFSILKKKTPHGSDTYLVSPFNDWSFDRRSAPLKPRYFANHIPMFDKNLCQYCDNGDCKEKGNAEKNNPKFFTCLAQSVKRGRKALGVFKADVDNLGLIFVNGFREKDDKSDKSISRITTLSRLLDTFFTGRLDHLLRTEFQNMYTVFAGGDDLLLIGPWGQTLDFALRLHKEFSAFSCDNPDFTISGGMAIVKPRLPIAAAIEVADGLLDEAKQNKSMGSDHPKDQLAVLNDCFKWDRAGMLLEEGDKLAAWQEEKRVSAGFVRQLLESAGQYRTFVETGETRHLRFVPMLAYSITRNIPARETEIMQWAHDLTNITSEKLKHLTFVANYSITTNRG